MTTTERMRGAGRLTGWRGGIGGRQGQIHLGGRLVRALAVLLLFVAATALGPALTTRASGLELTAPGGPAHGRLAADNHEDDEDDEDEAEAESPLAQRDPPPNAVDDLLGYFDADAGIENFCPATLSELDLSTPVVAISGGQFKEMGSLVFICVGGFAPNQNVEVRLTAPAPAAPSGGISSTGGTGPAGEVRRMRLRTTDDGAAEWRWPALPPGPRGQYSVVAEQGQRRATATFELGPAFSRRALVAPREARRGETFQIALAGYEPNEQARLILLRKDGDRWRYLTDVRPAGTDANGEAVIALETTRDDRAGQYMIAAAAPNDPNVHFSYAMFDVRR